MTTTAEALTQPHIGDEVFAYILPARRPRVVRVTTDRYGTRVTVRFPDGEHVSMPTKYLGLTRPGGAS